MKHIMIDLETLSTAPTAVVTQLGWAMFDPEAEVEGVIVSGVYHLDVQSQIDHGLAVDWSTISWWMKQDAVARNLLTDALNQVRASAALVSFSDSLPWSSIEGVWSHGATFDLVILDNLYRKAGRKVPWEFRAARDTRTLFWLAGKELTWPKNEVKHSAEHDAVAQAITVQRAVKILKRRSPCTSSESATSTTP